MSASPLRRLTSLLPRLLDAYGPQGWWPLRSLAGGPGFDAHGYHPGDYRQPLDSPGRLEVAVGAVLTQNTAWRNVEPALDALLGRGPLAPSAILARSLDDLATTIRSSGYFRQKARKLRALAEFVAALGARPPARDDLLAIWGVGPETADSILLYAWQLPHFVVDAYTRRLLSRLGLVDGTESYDTRPGAMGRRAPGRPCDVQRDARPHCPACQGALPQCS